MACQSAHLGDLPSHAVQQFAPVLKCAAIAVHDAGRSCFPTPLPTPLLLPRTVPQRLQLTRSRVAANIERVSELKSEAAALDRLKCMAEGGPDGSEAASATTAVATQASPTGAQPPACCFPRVQCSVDTLWHLCELTPAGCATSGMLPAPLLTSHRCRGMLAVRPVAPSRQPTRTAPADSGPAGGLELEAVLREFWYPAEFSAVSAPLPQDPTFRCLRRVLFD